MDSDEDMDLYRAAVGKLLNSLSRKTRIAPAETVDAEKTLLRVNLRDYGLLPADWEHIAGVYPYGLDVEPRTEKLLKKETGTSSVILRADWFVFAASQPPLYHRLLAIPDTVAELREKLGVKVEENLRAGEALRAGFRKSGVSQANRLIERHEMGDINGAWWESYDFTLRHSAETGDIFQMPLGPPSAGLTKDRDLAFQHDGGEIIFSLPNGLQAYMLAKANGERLSRAPVDIVQDSSRKDAVIINGISCMACHKDGMKLSPGSNNKLENFRDEVGPVILKTGLPFAEKRLVEKLFASPERLQRAVGEDAKRFQEAVTAAMGGFKPNVEPVEALYKRFLQDIPATLVSAEFGVDPEEFLRRLKDADNAQLAKLAAQIELGVPQPRQAFVRAFPAFAKELGFTPREFSSFEPEEFGGSPEVPAAKLEAVKTENRPSVGGKNTLTLQTKNKKEHYVEGEPLILELQVKQDSHVRIFSHTKGGNETVQLFPNGLDRNTLVRGGTQVTLPKAKGDFITRPPFGTDIIFAIASPAPFADTENLTFSEGERYKVFRGETTLLPALDRAFVVEDNPAATAATIQKTGEAATLPGGVPPGAATASITVTTGPK